jgi:hypothetical protein
MLVKSLVSMTDARLSQKEFGSSLALGKLAEELDKVQVVPVVPPLWFPMCTAEQFAESEVAYTISPAYENPLCQILGGSRIFFQVQ